MQKRTLFAAGITVLCLAAGVGYYLFNKPHENTRHVAPDAVVAAKELFSSYEADENAANGKYLGKVLRVSGRVTEVNRSDTAGNLVLGSNAGGGINCSFGTETLGELKNIHAGDSVSCKGRCTGYLMDVNLSDCVLEP